MTEHDKHRIEAEWKRLGGGRKGVDALRRFIEQHRISATIGVVDGVVVVTLIDARAKGRGFESFIMPIEGEPSPPSEAKPSPPSQAKREIDARHQATQSLIGGIVDSLELRYRADQAGEELRALSGGEAGPVGIFYDLVDLSSRTLRELLHLNARANRRLLTALQSLGPAASSLGVVRAGDGAVLRLAVGTSATLTLENKLTAELMVTIPDQIAVCRHDGTGSICVALTVSPPKVVLPRGARCDVEIKLAAAVAPAEHDLVGELVLGGSDSSAIVVAVVISGEPRGLA